MNNTDKNDYDDANMDDFECPLCFNHVGKTLETATIDKCQHTFCISCLQQWLIRSSSCPNDRNQFKELSVYNKLKNKKESLSVSLFLLQTIDAENDATVKNHLKIISNILSHQLICFDKFNLITKNLKIMFSPNQKDNFQKLLNTNLNSLDKELENFLSKMKENVLDYVNYCIDQGDLIYPNYSHLYSILGNLFVSKKHKRAKIRFSDYRYNLNLLSMSYYICNCNNDLLTSIQKKLSKYKTLFDLDEKVSLELHIKPLYEETELILHNSYNVIIFDYIKLNKLLILSILLNSNQSDEENIFDNNPYQCVICCEIVQKDKNSMKIEKLHHIICGNCHNFMTEYNLFASCQFNKCDRKHNFKNTNNEKEISIEEFEEIFTNCLDLNLDILKFVRIEFPSTINKDKSEFLQLSKKSVLFFAESFNFRLHTIKLRLFKPYIAYINELNNKMLVQWGTISIKFTNLLKKLIMYLYKLQKFDRCSVDVEDETEKLKLFNKHMLDASSRYQEWIDLFDEMFQLLNHEKKKYKKCKVLKKYFSDLN